MTGNYRRRYQAAVAHRKAIADGTRSNCRMSDTTITVSERTKERAASWKRKGETWDEFVCRCIDAMKGVDDSDGVDEVELADTVADEVVSRLERHM